jgi:DNA-binding CsgD family transcriptional regulator
LDPDLAARIYASQMYAVYEDRGRLAELAEPLERFAEQMPAIPNWRCALAALYSQTGREADARAQLEYLAADNFACLLREWHWLLGLALTSYACIALRDLPRAAALYELLLPYADRCVAPPWAQYHRGSASYYLGRLAGLLSRWDVAARHFEDALAMHRAMSARPWVAHAQHDYAVVLLDREKHTGTGDQETVERARAMLREALETARLLGMAPLAEQAQQLLDTISPAIDPRASMVAHRPSFPSALTAREMEVLRLLAAGLTNKEIAAELVLAPGTVHRHLVNIYAKIGARRRVDAAAFAMQHGLGSPV